MSLSHKLILYLVSTGGRVEMDKQMIQFLLGFFLFLLL